MKKLTVTMADDWDVYSKLGHEHDALCRSYAMGKRITIAYASKRITDLTSNRPPPPPSNLRVVVCADTWDCAEFCSGTAKIPVRRGSRF